MIITLTVSTGNIPRCSMIPAHDPILPKLKVIFQFIQTRYFNTTMEQSFNIELYDWFDDRIVLRKKLSHRCIWVCFCYTYLLSCVSTWAQKSTSSPSLTIHHRPLVLTRYCFIRRFNPLNFDFDNLQDVKVFISRPLIDIIKTQYN